MKKHKILTVAGFIVSILLLYLSLKDIKFNEIIEILKKADLKLIFIPTLFIFISAALSAFKWSNIAGKDVRFQDTFIALIIGLFVNNVLPARIGEIVKGYVLSRKTGISFTFGLSTVLIDRFFDLAGLLLIVFIFFPKQSLPPKVSQSLFILVIVLIVFMATMIIMSREKFTDTTVNILGKVKKPFLLKFAHRLIEIGGNIRRINSPLNIIFYVAISFLQWLCMSTALYFATLTLNVSVKFIYIPFICALLNMGLTIPSSPGYVGVYQFLLVYILSIFNVPKQEGFAVSIMFHASWYIPYNILGFIFLLKEHIKIKDMQELDEKNA
ncbi:MAG: lysylphosphatidylglycerol synthase transmembrane domain-containing protein [Proteobacteria bacterium]|nr:lysylphosphatidylglycerol synthase transmembrane domain-containing protein [Pseudomonadota bacterium]